jgi:beta-galactosidase
VIPATIAMQHDFGRSILGKPFLIMEQQSGKAGQATFSPQPEPGQVRLWSYQGVAHGAMGINYFRWDTATLGAEQYWHGMLNHDRSQSPAFGEILQTVKELQSLGPEFLNSGYEADSALYFDYDCSWAIKIQPGHFRLSYAEQATNWYGAASPSHTGIDVIGPGSDLSPYKIVFAPVVYVLAESQADKIRQYVKGGGVLLTSFRLGVKTPSSQIVRTPLPGFLADVMGVTLEDYVPIYAQNPRIKFNAMLAGADAECGIWADILKPSTAEALATYSSGQHSGKAAITLNRFGKGKAVYVGADLRGPDLSKVLAAFVDSAGIKRPIDVPAGVELTVRKNANKRWLCVLNHKSESQTINLDGSFKDSITGQAHSGAADIPGYGVLVLERM